MVHALLYHLPAENYVGQTRRIDANGNPIDRMKSHKYNGKNVDDYVVMWIGDTSQKELDEMESYYIGWFNSWDVEFGGPGHGANRNWGSGNKKYTLPAFEKGRREGIRDSR